MQTIDSVRDFARDSARKKQIIAQTSDACSNMITGIRQIKLSVLDLFSTLADNGPDPHRNHQQFQENLVINSANKLYHQQNLTNLATSHSLCTSSTPPIRIQKQQEQHQQLDLIQYVSQMISTITTTIRGLEQDMMILMQNSGVWSSLEQTRPFTAPPGLISPGESIHLAMDSSLDKHNLYMDLCKSYKTYAKLHDYSQHCHAFLHQQSLKRVHKRFETSSSNQSRDSRTDSILATFNPYVFKIYLSKSSVMATLENILKTSCPYVDGTYSQPFGVSTGVFQISVNRVLKAILVMRGIVIDAVIVKAYHESFASKATRNGGSSAALLAAEAGGSPFVDPDDDIDLWSESKYAVFRKLTHHANAAVLHFQYPTFPEIAVKSFLVSNHIVRWRQLACERKRDCAREFAKLVRYFLFDVYTLFLFISLFGIVNLLSITNSLVVELLSE